MRLILVDVLYIFHQNFVILARLIKVFNKQIAHIISSDAKKWDFHTKIFIKLSLDLNNRLIIREGDVKQLFSKNTLRE